MKNFSLNIKKSGRKGNLLACLLMVTASLLLSTSVFATDDMTYWNLKRNSNWLNTNGYGFGETINAGTVTEFTFTAFWVKATFQNWWANKIYCYYTLNGHDVNNYCINYTCKACGYHVWESGDNVNFNALTNANINNPGENTLGLYFQVYQDGNKLQEKNAFVNFTLPGFTQALKSQTDFSAVVGGDAQSKTISFGNHYGTKLTTGNCSVSPSTDDFSVTSISETGVTVKFNPASSGTKSATLTITDANSKTCTITLQGTAETGTTPTVFNAQEPLTQAGSFEATLYGYLKYTGCEVIVENGFIYSTTRANLEGDTPTGSQIYNTVASMTAGTPFQKTSTYASGTYYYRSFVKTNEQVYYYSPKNDIGVFVIDGTCSTSDPVVATISTASAVLSAGVAATLSSTTNASMYDWQCVTKPDGATASFASGSTKTTDVTVDRVGDYTFQLKAKCTDEAEYRTSNTVSLHVCTPPTVQQLYLDEETENIVCAGEKSTATIISQEGYDYTLTSATKNYGTQVGSGATLTWRNVDGTGTYTVIASEHGTGFCQASMTTATQELSEAALVVNATTLSAIAYQSVTLSVDDDASTIDHDPEWTITAGPSGYLVDVDTRLVYDAGKQRSSVDFKGGATAATTYTVTASTTYTETLSHTSKVCDASTNVNIQVTPATEKCD